MAATTKDGTHGVVITVDGHWRCVACGHTTATTPVCAGAYDDGSPRCGKAVCEKCSPRCIRCKAQLCPDCYARSREGALCMHCPPPPGGRQAYMARQQARAAQVAGTSTGQDWRADSDRAYHAAAQAQRSVDDAMRRADEIDRQINEMKARMRRKPNT